MLGFSRQLIAFRLAGEMHANELEALGQFTDRTIDRSGSETLDSFSPTSKDLITSQGATSLDQDLIYHDTLLGNRHFYFSLIRIKIETPELLTGVFIFGHIQMQPTQLRSLGGNIYYLW